jgi:hypothetical protein
MGVIKLECGTCGSNRCELRGTTVDKAWIVCAVCGDNLITYLELHAEIARQAQAYATKSITSCFGCLPAQKPVHEVVRNACL